MSTHQTNMKGDKLRQFQFFLSLIFAILFLSSKLLQNFFQLEIGLVIFSIVINYCICATLIFIFSLLERMIPIFINKKGYKILPVLIIIVIVNMTLNSCFQRFFIAHVVFTLIANIAVLLFLIKPYCIDGILSKVLSEENKKLLQNSLFTVTVIAVVVQMFLYYSSLRMDGVKVFNSVVYYFYFITYLVVSIVFLVIIRYLIPSCKYCDLIFRISIVSGICFATTFFLFDFQLSMPLYPSIFFVNLLIISRVRYWCSVQVS